MGLIFKIFDQGHKFGLINNLVNYFGLGVIEDELCELDYMLGKKISNNVMTCSQEE